MVPEKETRQFTCIYAGFAVALYSYALSGIGAKERTSLQRYLRMEQECEEGGGGTL